MDDLGRIVKVAGPLVVAENMAGFKMFDVVYVSDKKLMGEIIEFNKDLASIQVYEETGGIGVGEPVYPTGGPLTVELGPGLLQSIYDGIQRPLDEIYKNTGNFIARGVSASALRRERKWKFEPMAKKGDKVSDGDFLGFVNETEIIRHYIMIPPGIDGEGRSIEKGEFTVEDTIAILKDSRGDRKITMMQKWPVREPRPYLNKICPDMPLFTGQRVIDMFFPIARGGTACIPGPFCSGKTVVQHQLAKWINAEIIVYIGCGERGNEMTEVLMEFPELTDPRSGVPLMKRTVLIANTSNMPVAAREASVYTGITIAEYFRDMGYSVALMADSTSRWAEAMREISGRLEEMPGEEGYPAYLGTRIAEFYERSGGVSVLCSGNREASLRKEVAHDIVETRQEAMKILQEEAELAEIVKLVGVDSLSPGDRITLETARSLREELAKIKVKEDIARSKYIPEDQSAQLDKIARSAESEIEVLKKMYSQKEV